MSVAAKRLMSVGEALPAPVLDVSYEDTVSEDSPFAWWRLEETSGGTVEDFLENHDGTVDGCDLNVNGVFGTGSAASFDGNDSIVCGTLGSFGSSLGSGFSVEFWAKWTSSSVMRMGNGLSGDMTLFVSFNEDVDQNNQAGRLRVFVRDASGDSHSRDTDIAGLNNDTWHHVVITWDGSASAVDAFDIYVDGLNRSDDHSTQGTPSNFEDFTASNAWTWGARTANGSVVNHFTGSLDEPALYLSVLTAAQISDHFFAGLNGHAELHGDADGMDVGDIDEDGTLDVVTASGDNGTVEWWKQTDLVTWTEHTIDTGLTEVEGALVGDFDDDGTLEVVALDQGGGTVRFYKHGGDPTGAWTGVTLASSRPNAQDAQAIDIDGDGIPEIVYTFEGSGSGSGGVRWLDFDGTDPTDPADWTEYTMATQEGAWWLASSGPADIAGNGRDDIVFSARDNANANAVPGIYYLEKPADPTGVWTVRTIDSTSADWLHVDLGDFSGDGNGKDVIAYDLDGNQGLRYYQFSDAWSSTALPTSDAGSGQFWNARTFDYSESTRDAVIHVGDDAMILIYWDGAAWDSFPIFGTGYDHPTEDRIIATDLGGDSTTRLVLPDSGGNRWFWITAP